ncbi:hypothetical protein BDP27DRAFT_1425934 [Rhodocollybia butyracea]|uniref:Uncharacterized protein n=1 Tax=Rhodocollybia butyracea TaxID=206335 RepID=A0A9P5PJG1_9AGAR|nr:hypothetical protein BDP27DRAFT_1425934 [Rhodocollybia butyracea]
MLSLPSLPFSRRELQRESLGHLVNLFSASEMDGRPAVDKALTENRQSDGSDDEVSHTLLSKDTDKPTGSRRDSHARSGTPPGHAPVPDDQTPRPLRNLGKQRQARSEEEPEPEVTNNALMKAIQEMGKRQVERDETVDKRFEQNEHEIREIKSQLVYLTSVGASRREQVDSSGPRPPVAAGLPPPGRFAAPHAPAVPGLGRSSAEFPGYPSAGTAPPPGPAGLHGSNIPGGPTTGSQTHFTFTPQGGFTFSPSAPGASTGRGYGFPQTDTFGAASTAGLGPNPPYPPSFEPYTSQSAPAAQNPLDKDFWSVPPLLHVPKHKSAAENERVRIIRQSIRKLIGGRQNDQIDTVTATELEDFADDFEFNEMARPCTGQNFRYSISARPHCPWNVGASYVFVTACEERGWVFINQPEDRAVLRIFFLKRIENLHGLWLQKHRDTSEYIRQKADNRKARKYGLYNRRHEIFKKFEPLRHHKQLFERLGADGMSSDEDDETQTWQFVIVQPRWRSSELTQFLRFLDQVHIFIQTKGSSKRPRGSLPRIRKTRPDPIYVSEKQPPKGLPYNAYSMAWLDFMQPGWQAADALPGMVTTILTPSKDHYPFEIPSEVRAILSPAAGHPPPPAGA